MWTSQIDGGFAFVIREGARPCSRVRSALRLMLSGFEFRLALATVARWAARWMAAAEVDMQ